MPTRPSNLRQSIALACTQQVEVGGATYAVTGRELPPATISPLDAWPVWQRTTWLNSCVRESTWYVVVALPPTNVKTYFDMADAFTVALGDALQRVGGVVAVTPQQIAASDANAPLPCLQFELLT